MILKEAGMVRQMKYAQQRTGYTVFNRGSTLVIYTAAWYVEIREADLMRKVLATVVEHCGYLPEEAEGVKIKKDADPQVVMPEELAAAINEFVDGATEPDSKVVYTQITAYRHELFQDTDARVWAVPVSSTDLVDPSNKLAKTYGHLVITTHGSKILAEDMYGCAIMWASRPAMGTIPNETVTELFNALERVNLAPPPPEE